jgi:hypothetical protein
MNIGGKLFAAWAVLFFIIAGVYAYMSHDPIGTTVIALTGGLAFLIAFYVLFTSKRLGVLPEDVEDANIEDADSQYGFFSPHSWWPLAIGVAVTLFVLGFIFANWLLVLGVGALMGAVFGLLFEYYQGEFVQ